MDLLLVDGDLPSRNVLVSGRTDVRQRVTLRLSRFLGEWFLDLDAGLPYLDWLETKPPDVPSIVARIRTEIAAVDGVAATQNFSGTFDPETRVITITGEYLVSDEVEEISLTTDTATMGLGAPWSLFYPLAGTGVGS